LPPPAAVTVTGTIPKHGHGVSIGQYAEVERAFTKQDIEAYGILVGDRNPLHSEWKLGSEPDVVTSSPLLTWQKENNDDVSKVLAHGMLVASLFSCIFGTHIPGSIYLNQALNFSKPVYADDLVKGQVTVKSIRQWRRKGIVLSCDTIILGQNSVKHVFGKADVWLVHGYGYVEQ
jgi:acyl dehydratase